MAGGIDNGDAAIAHQRRQHCGGLRWAQRIGACVLGRRQHAEITLLDAQVQCALGLRLVIDRLQRHAAVDGLIGAALPRQQHAQGAVVVAGIAGRAAGAGVVAGHDPVVMLEIEPCRRIDGAGGQWPGQRQQGGKQGRTHGHPCAGSGSRTWCAQGRRRASIESR
ncbi:hypothetical protein D3C73_862950 [compost metagenome]